MATRLYLYDNIDVYEEFGAVLQHKTISLPEPKTKYIEVPGMDGSYDASTILTDGIVKYKSRNIKLSFHLATNDFINYVNGRKFNFYFDDDEEYEYYGRWVLGGITNEKGFIKVDFNITCDNPYKIQREYTHVKLKVVGEKSIKLENEAMWCIPEIYCASPMELKIRQETYTLQQGRNYREDLLLNNGTNFITIIGNGKVEIDYKAGRF